MKKIIVMFFFISAFKSLGAYPYSNLPGDDCSTLNNYDNNTKATVFGDSRMDLAAKDSLYSWGQELDQFLSYPESNWNVQNFGLSGLTAQGLKEKLVNCLNNEKFRIHKNIVYHIGGNEFVQGMAWQVTIYPWRFDHSVNYVMNRNEQIVSMFMRRGKHVLLSGHYPSLAQGNGYKNIGDYYDMHGNLLGHLKEQDDELIKMFNDGLKKTENGILNFMAYFSYADKVLPQNLEDGAIMLNVPAWFAFTKFRDALTFNRNVNYLWPGYYNTVKADYAMAAA